MTEGRKGAVHNPCVITGVIHLPVSGLQILCPGGPLVLGKLGWLVTLVIKQVPAIDNWAQCRRGTLGDYVTHMVSVTHLRGNGAVVLSPHLPPFISC